MKSWKVLSFACAALLASVSVLPPVSSVCREARGARFLIAPQESAAAEKLSGTLNVVTAGDTNNEATHRNKLGPAFESANPGVKVNVVGTGVGEDGSRKIYEKLKAQQKAGRDKWDIDVGIVYQATLADLMKDGLLMRYVPGTKAARYVTSETAKNAMGANVAGYVIPLYHNTVAIASLPDRVPDPPKTFEELVGWIEANPGRFGYNGIKGGMSGVGFAVGWVYWKSGKYETLSKGPYDEGMKAEFIPYLKELKDLPVTITAGNAGTLEMLNRGEIDMGAVWVDQVFLWQNEGRMRPDVRMVLLEPGLPGLPLYIVIPQKAANPSLAKKYVEFIASPEMQAKHIVESSGWYPGIDGNAVLPKVSEAAKARLFADISPDQLLRFNKSLPLGSYYRDILSAYEEAR